jgi:hypothetical protein
MAKKHIRTVMELYRDDVFKNRIEARGAFELAYQQGVAGLGDSVQEWMGLNDREYDDWLRDETLPPPK